MNKDSVIVSVGDSCFGPSSQVELAPPRLFKKGLHTSHALRASVRQRNLKSYGKSLAWLTQVFCITRRMMRCAGRDSATV
jgi:hypothetical protein